jgi:hypothetical protein
VHACGLAPRVFLNEESSVLLALEHSALVAVWVKRAVNSKAKASELCYYLLFAFFLLLLFSLKGLALQANPERSGTFSKSD